MIAISLQVRAALPGDRQQIANLMFFESRVHRHLDWRAPLDWLGSPFFWVIEENGRIVAALACPPDPPKVAWVRLFTHANHLLTGEAWRYLWATAGDELSRYGGATVAAIALQGWLQEVLLASGFRLAQHILMLEWKARPMSAFPLPPEMTLRAMTEDDLPGVAALDAVAFARLWQNSFAALMKAYPQTIAATVAEDAQGLIGYQMSTGNPFGAHLARLAVLPGAQGRGVGSALVGDLLFRLQRQGVVRLSVNTQEDNYASLALYRRFDFRPTSEQYPVYCFEVPPS